MSKSFLQEYACTRIGLEKKSSFRRRGGREQHTSGFANRWSWSGHVRALHVESAPCGAWSCLQTFGQFESPTGGQNWTAIRVASCPLFPQKRTLAHDSRMSALCQKRTSAHLDDQASTRLIEPRKVPIADVNPPSPCSNHTSEERLISKTNAFSSASSQTGLWSTRRPALLASA
jgi:hypothetical protein